MSWYKRAMPSRKDLSPIIDDICKQIRAIGGVTAVHVWGSYVDQKDPNYPIKDLDIIASTAFDAGDLMAIDNSRYSALRIRPTELEDEGFNPKAVGFTKQFLSFEKYNVDHWAASKDGKLLHWGAIPESNEDWAELHTEAESRAEKDTGLKRTQLVKCSDDRRKDWKRAYDSYLSMVISSKSAGWCPTEHAIGDILNRAQQMGE